MCETTLDALFIRVFAMSVYLIYFRYVHSSIKSMADYATRLSTVFSHVHDINDRKDNDKTLASLRELLAIQDSGRLDVTVGCMSAGKTQKMFSICSTLADMGESVCVITHADDTRNLDSHMPSTHSSTMNLTNTTERIKFIKTADLCSVNVDSYSAICVDEAQFFNELYRPIKDWLFNHNKKIYVFGLDGDAHQNMFGKIYSLLPIAHTFTKLHSTCVRCIDLGKSLGTTIHNEAAFTILIRDSHHNQHDHNIGGLDKYSPVCLYHATK